MGFTSEENLDKIVSSTDENHENQKKDQLKTSVDEAALKDPGNITLSSQDNENFESASSLMSKHMEKLTVTIQIKGEKGSSDDISDDSSRRLITNTGETLFPRSFDENMLAGIKTNRRSQQRTVSNSSYSSETGLGVFDKSRLNFSTRSSESSCSSIQGSGN